MPVLTATLFELIGLSFIDGKIVDQLSAISNCRKLFSLKENSSEISCLAGLKVITMAWIVIYHTYMVHFNATLSFSYLEKVRT